MPQLSPTSATDRARRLRMVIAALVLMISGLLGVTAPASASPTAQVAAASGPTYVLEFHKNPSDNTNGRLQLVSTYPNEPEEGIIWSMRAGSGHGSSAQDSCATSKGWLPDGHYTATPYANWPGTGVRGPVVKLSNHTCHNGTLRTELFIHSTYPWSTSHYESEGCIKLKNTGSDPAHTSGDVKTMYDAAVKYHVHTVIVSTD